MGLKKHQINNTSFKKGIIPWIKGKTHSEETRKKLRLSHLGKKLSPESIQKRTETRKRLYAEGKLVSPMKGKHQSEISKNKIMKALQNRVVSDETRKKMSESRIGIRPSAETIKKLSESHKGHIHSEEHKAKIRASSPRGKNSHMWQGGKSFELYTIDWTETLKRSIRERDRYTCQLNGEIQGDICFSVHHIDYNKKNCDPNNLITLCNRCHMKTNFNREYWIEYFTKLMLQHTNCKEVIKLGEKW